MACVCLFRHASEFADCLLCSLCKQGYVFRSTVGVQGVKGQRLREELGFDAHSPWVHDGAQLTEVLAIRSVVPGGILQSAGVRNGDIVTAIEWKSNGAEDSAEYDTSGGNFITHFYRILENARGNGTIIVTVISSADSFDDKRLLSSREYRKHAFCVPSELR